MNLTDVLVDFSIVSVLLIIAAFLRRKIKLFQRLYIPAALIAGAVGLLLGPQVLGRFSPICLEYSAGIGQWAGVLTAIVFASSFLGIKLSKVSGSALQTYFLAGTVHQLQVVVGLTVTFLLGLVFADLQFGFGILPVLGFYGGHGMAIAGGQIFADAGYMPEGAAVGATFGTIGMFCGIVWGMAIINKAAQKGITRVQMKRDELPQSMLTGYYPPEERGSIGNSVTASATLDPFASQLMLVGFIILCGHILRTVLISIHPFWTNLPLFACSLIFGGIFCILTQNNKRINDMIDRRTITRISGTALDYMITAAIATTSLSVFVTYGIPLLVVSIAVGVITYVGSFILGRIILPKGDFFETAIGLFGQTCGVLATGLMLLKVIDPEYHTNAATNITSSSTLGYTYQLQYTLVFVAMVMTRPLFVYLWSWMLLAVLLGAGLFFARRMHRKEAAEGAAPAEAQQ